MSQTERIAQFLEKPVYFGHVTLAETQAFSQDELKAAMDRMQDPDDWRGPINARIPVAAFEVSRVACNYFTATQLEAFAYFEHDHTFNVRAVGYRDGPCGP